MGEGSWLIVNLPVRNDAFCMYSMFEKEITAWQNGGRQKGGARWTDNWSEIDLPVKEPVALQECRLWQLL